MSHMVINALPDAQDGGGANDNGGPADVETGPEEEMEDELLYCYCREACEPCGGMGVKAVLHQCRSDIAEWMHTVRVPP